MIRRARRRLSYSNVVATLSLFLVLGGGTAIAVNRNSVGSKELKKDAVKGRHVANDKIKGKHVQEEKLKGKHLKDGTVEGPDVAEGTLGKVPAAQNATAAFSAGNADKLDGFNAGGLVRVAGDSSTDVPDGGDVLNAQINAPRSGFLHVVGSLNLTRSASDSDYVNCSLRVDGSIVDGTLRELFIEGPAADSRALCGTNAVTTVTPGGHEVEMFVSNVGEDTFVLDGALNVFFTPFDGSGS